MTTKPSLSTQRGELHLYAIIALSVALGSTALVSQLSQPRARATSALVTIAVLVLLHTTSTTVRLHTEWWERTQLENTPHAYAVVEAIRSSVDLPIRCLPSPGTPVTSQTRWAAYFCARWVEDAFNDGRFSGRRSDFLSAEGPNFDATVEAVLADHPEEYLFAYVMPMGPGWFGWSGIG